MASEKILNVGESDFQEKVLGSDKPVLVDFWAVWCGPCKTIAPLLEEAAEKYADQLQVAKVNVDDHPSIAAKYGVRGIPTLILWKGGEIVDQLVGAVPRGQIDGLIQKAI